MAAVWDRVDAELARRGMSWAELGRGIGASDQAMHNWKQRGVPASRHKAIADAFGWTVDRLIAEHWTPEHPPMQGLSGHPKAHDLSLSRRDDAPIRIEWERILKDPLKREFQTVMPDASMEPDIPRGAGIIFVTDLQPAPGDWVLIKDRDGAPFVRELRQVKPGRWEAHALNPAFLPMDSERDGLEVLAVFDGLRGRKARV